MEGEFIRIQAEAKQLNQVAAANYVMLFEQESDMLDHIWLPVGEYAAAQLLAASANAAARAVRPGTATRAARTAAR